ncbi:VWA domain-containing protein [Vibrio sp. 99-70-13A1]|nr:VWA domain-containing protein [Vibrio sp. 99-70-13A1]
MLLMEFEYSWVFALLPIPLFIYLLAPQYQTQRVAIRVPFFTRLVEDLQLNVNNGSSDIKPGRWQRFSLVFGWILLVISAAKPVWLGDEETRDLDGRDLMVLVDLSGSMSTTDFYSVNGVEESRLQAAKQVLSEFSEQRKGDRLGLIVFGDFAYMQSPFTADHKAWLSLLKESQVAMAGPSTHLGDAIGLGIKTYLSEEAIDYSEGNKDKNKGKSRDGKDTRENDKQRVMIVLTDGNDTNSLVPPIDAAKVAAANNIRIHTIAMGNPNTAGEQALEVETLNSIASITGGQSFLAMSYQELQLVYQMIADLEPTVYKSFTFQPKVSLHFVPVILLVLHHLLFMAVSLFRTRQCPNIGEEIK